METRGVSRPIAYPVNQLQVAPLGLYPVKWHVVVPAKLVEFREHVDVIGKLMHARSTVLVRDCEAARTMESTG